MGLPVQRKDKKGYGFCYINVKWTNSYGYEDAPKKKRGKERERDRQTDTDRQRQTETDRDRQTESFMDVNSCPNALGAF